MNPLSRNGRNMKRLLIALPLVAIVLFGAGRLLADTVSPHLYTGTVLQDSAPAPVLDELSYVDGTPVDLAANSGSVTLLYFGFTHCPDICPTALSDAATALRGLSDADQDRVTLTMVTVDPDRDVQPALQDYVEFFDANFTSASGSREAIDRAAASYGVFYEYGEGTIETGYTVDHTATMLAIDTTGSLRVVWPPNVTPDQLRNDIKELLNT